MIPYNVLDAISGNISVTKEMFDSICELLVGKAFTNTAKSQYIYFSRIKERAITSDVISYKVLYMDNVTMKLYPPMHVFYTPSNKIGMSIDIKDDSIVEISSDEFKDKWKEMSTEFLCRAIEDTTRI